MPQVIPTTVYLFNELPNEAAKEKAREWYKELIETSEWSDYVKEQWEQEELPTMGFVGAEISFSGFWSQGDGASFTSGFDLLAFLKHTKTTCRPIVLKLLESGRLSVRGGFRRTSSRYSHENTVSFDYEHDNGKELPNLESYLDGLLSDIGERGAYVQNFGRATMREIYKELERAHDFEHSNENVDDTIEENEYTFTETGERFG